MLVGLCFHRPTERRGVKPGVGLWHALDFSTEGFQASAGQVLIDPMLALRLDKPMEF